MKKPMWIAGLLVACVILTIVPFIAAPKDAGFGGADDAAGELVGEIDPEYEPWAEPVLEKRKACCSVFRQLWDLA